MRHRLAWTAEWPAWVACIILAEARILLPWTQGIIRRIRTFLGGSLTWLAQLDFASSLRRVDAVSAAFSPPSGSMENRGSVSIALVLSLRHYWGMEVVLWRTGSCASIWPESRRCHVIWSAWLERIAWIGLRYDTRTTLYCNFYIKSCFLQILLLL